MDFHEMSNVVDETTDYSLLIAAKLTPILAEVLKLEEPWELSFSEVSLVQLPTDYRERKYQLRMNVSLPSWVE